MAEIFISYARADRARAEQVAQALERTGWSVWWDRDIPPGRSFDEVIEEALSLARCVIVLWSEASVRSEWVKTEASDAAQRRILVPILADGARIPLEFRRIQAAAITDWRRLESNDGWAQLCDAVGALLGAVRPMTPAPARRRRAGPLWVAGGVASVTLALAAAALVLATRPQHAATAVATAPAPAARAVAPLPPEPEPESAPAAAEPPPAVRARVSAATADKPRTPPAGAVVTRLPEPVPQPHTDAAPALVEPTMATGDVVKKLDRAPRDTSFDVTVFYGVFRDQAGRLSVSGDGVRFHESGGGRAFDVSCGALRRVATATMIADRDQRLVELTADGQSYRVRAADTSARDTLRAAISQTCNR